jgi:transcriptional regulator NrdR family protein
MADGIACPYCGCTSHSVLETRTDDDSILRRRQCDDCELPFPTHEEADDDFAARHTTCSKNTG